MCINCYPCEQKPGNNLYTLFASVGYGMPVHPVINGLAGDTKFSGNFADITVMRIEQMQKLVFFPCLPFFLPLAAARRLRCCDNIFHGLSTVMNEFNRQLIESHHTVDGKVGGSFHHILQFTDVAGPGIGIQVVHKILIHGEPGPPVSAEFIKKVLKEQRDILGSLP